MSGLRPRNGVVVWGVTWRVYRSDEPGRVERDRRRLGVRGAKRR